MRLIKLTELKSGIKKYVNVDYILTLEHNPANPSAGTYIHVVEYTIGYIVKETPETIINLIRALK